MTEDMTIRGFAPKTQASCFRAIPDFTDFLGCSPDSAGAEDLRRYQPHMRSGGASATSMNAAVSALRFFFGVTLGWDDANEGMTTVRAPRKLSVILSPEEVRRLLDAASGLKYKAALSVAYGAGLRASEVVALKVSDIDSDSERRVIRVEQGKGRKDRYATLAAPTRCPTPEPPLQRRLCDLWSVPWPGSYPHIRHRRLGRSRVRPGLIKWKGQAVHSQVRRGIAEGLWRVELRPVAFLAVMALGLPKEVAALTWIEDIVEEGGKP